MQSKIALWIEMQLNEFLIRIILQSLTDIWYSVGATFAIVIAADNDLFIAVKCQCDQLELYRFYLIDIHIYFWTKVIIGNLKWKESDHIPWYAQHFSSVLRHYYLTKLINTSMGIKMITRLDEWGLFTFVLIEYSF